MSGKKKSTPEPTTTTAQGGQTTKARVWAHRIVDHKVAAERALGSGRR